MISHSQREKGLQMKLKWWTFFNQIALAFITMVVVASSQTVLQLTARGALLAVVVGLPYLARKSALLRELPLLEKEWQQTMEEEKV